MNMDIKLPVLVYDGGCGFCKFWVDRWQDETKEITFVPFQKLEGSFFGVKQANFQEAVYFFTEDKSEFQGAEAIFKLLEYQSNRKWFWLYHNIPGADIFFEFCYNVISNNRAFFYTLVKLCPSLYDKNNQDLE